MVVHKLVVDEVLVTVVVTLVVLLVAAVVVAEMLPLCELAFVPARQN